LSVGVLVFVANLKNAISIFVVISYRDIATSWTNNLLVVILQLVEIRFPNPIKNIGSGKTLEKYTKNCYCGIGTSWSHYCDSLTLEERFKEEASNDDAPLIKVPQYSKNYIIDEVAIVLPLTLRHDPYKGESPKDGVFDGPTKTKESNLVDDGEPSKPMFIGKPMFKGEHSTKEESEKLRLLLKEYRD